MCSTKLLSNWENECTVSRGWPSQMESHHVMLMFASGTACVTVVKSHLQQSSMSFLESEYLIGVGPGAVQILSAHAGLNAMDLLEIPYNLKHHELRLQL